MLTDKGNGRGTNRKNAKNVNPVIKVVSVAMGIFAERETHDYRICNGQVMDQERSTNGLCRMINRCITDKTNMYRICNGQKVR